MKWILAAKNDRIALKTERLKARTTKDRVEPTWKRWR